jgi:hypothetical protein
MHNGSPLISLLNISVYRLQPRLFMDSPPYLKKKGHEELWFTFFGQKNARFQELPPLMALRRPQTLGLIF